jgi:S1-C subfamily serine protease
MQDEESGGAQQGGWQPPEYVSPWLPASSSGDDDANGGDTIAFGGAAAHDAGQGPASGPGYDAGRRPAGGPAYGPAQGSGRGPVYGPAQGAAGGPGYPTGAGYPAGAGYPGGPAYGGQAGSAYGPGAGYTGDPGYGGGPGYGGPGYGGPGYGPPGYGQDPWGGYGAPPPPPRSGFSRTLAYLAVAVIAAGAGAGVAVALNHSSSTPAAIAPTNPNSGTGNGGTSNGGTGNGNAGTGNGTGNGFGALPGGTGNSGNSGTGGTNTGTGSLNATALAAKVDPGLVDVTSDLKYSNATAEGTGMVLTSTGLVLTNNHVIDEATSVTATLVVSGKTYTARVVGYDDTDDVALLQLVGASGLKTVNLGNSTDVKVNEAVLALGNAGGRGGLPSTAQGTIQGLNKSIQASDEGAGTTENLTGMLETDAPIEEGDSGGPLVNGSGQVVGMDTAANSGETAQGATAVEGFAIPINKAVTIADEIADGKASTSVHLGLAGFMGVNVANANSPSDCETGGGDGFGGLGGYAPAVNSGALICSVAPGAPAATAGLAGGDVITSVNGGSVSTANGLTNLMSGSKPGSRLTVVYVDENGAKHTTTVTLTEWAK